MIEPNKQAMPKWLVYGLAAKIVLIVAIIVFVLWKAKVF